MLRHIRTWLVGLTTTAALAGTVSVCRADPINLVTNGSFESHGELFNTPGDPSSGTVAGVMSQDGGAFYTLFPNSNPMITGWTTGPVSIDYKSNSYWQASNGNWSLDLDGTYKDGNAANTQDSKGYVQTSVATTAGTSYQVSFDLAGNPDGNSPNYADNYKAVQVNVFSGIDNHLISTDTYWFNTTGYTRGSMGWESVAGLIFTADGSDIVQFKSLTFGQYGTALDNVSVTYFEMPEPGSMTLLGLGGLGLFGFARRRRAG